MGHKALEIDNELWKAFGKRCVNNDVFIKDRIAYLIKKDLKGEIQ